MNCPPHKFIKSNERFSQNAGPNKKYWFNVFKCACGETTAVEEHSSMFQEKK